MPNLEAPEQNDFLDMWNGTAELDAMYTGPEKTAEAIGYWQDFRKDFISNRGYSIAEFEALEKSVRLEAREMIKEAANG